MTPRVPAVQLRNVLEQVIDYRGKSIPKANTGIPLITAKNVREGVLDFSEKEFISEDAYDEWMSRGIPRKGDIIFTTEAPLGNVAPYPEYGKYAIGQRTVVLRPKLAILDSSYLLQFLLSPVGKKRVEIRATGSTAKGIKSSELKKIEIELLPLDEQREIGRLLRKWDQAIEKAEKLIEIKEKRHAGLIQSLLWRNPRRKHWETHALGEFLKERIEKSTIHNQYPIVTSSRRGIYLQEEYFSKKVASANTTGYKIILRNDFTFRSMTDDGLFVFNQLKDLDAGIISPAYGVFYPDGMDASFVYYYLNSEIFARSLNRESQGGTRKALRFSAIKDVEVDIPLVHEQERIGLILNYSAKEIALERERLDLQKKQKRGLMQKLLTGEWRVKVAKEVA